MDACPPSVDFRCGFWFSLRGGIVVYAAIATSSDVCYHIVAAPARAFAVLVGVGLVS
jgi:hypothetical protein